MFMVYAKSVGIEPKMLTATSLDEAKMFVGQLVTTFDKVECWEMGKSDIILYSSIRMAGDIEHTVRTAWN